MSKKSFEFIEFVSEKLPQWSNPSVRLEKKLIQKQKMNRHYSGWLHDVKLLDPEELKKLAPDEGDAAQWKRDHARYVRKALFYEYTFKRKCIKYQKRSDISKTDVNQFSLVCSEEKSSSSNEKNTKNENENISAEESVLVNGEIDGNSNVQVIGGELTPSSHEISCQSDNVEVQVYQIVLNLVEDALPSALDSNVRRVVRVLKAGMLYDCVLEIARRKVKCLIDNTSSEMKDICEPWMSTLVTSGPDDISHNVVRQVFDMPSYYLESKIVKSFSSLILEPIAEMIMKLHVTPDRSQVTTSFNRLDVAGLVATELKEKQDVCSTFKVAEEVSHLVAKEVFDVSALNVEVLDPELMDSLKHAKEATLSAKNTKTSLQVVLKTAYEKHIAEISRRALQQAKKNLKHLRHPIVARAEINKSRASDKEKLESKKLCQCKPHSQQNAPPFFVPHFKHKSNLVFRKESVPVPKENTISAVLYPKYNNNLKLVCNSSWNCKAYPIERELRDIPYRFSYAPPRVVKQIKETKRLKKSDRPIVVKVMKTLEKHRLHNDMDAVLQKIFDDKASKLHTVTKSKLSLLPEYRTSKDNCSSQPTKEHLSNPLVPGRSNRTDQEYICRTLPSSGGVLRNTSSILSKRISHDRTLELLVDSAMTSERSPHNPIRNGTAPLRNDRSVRISNDPILTQVSKSSIERSSQRIRQQASDVNVLPIKLFTPSSGDRSLPLQSNVAIKSEGNAIDVPSALNSSYIRPTLKYFGARVQKKDGDPSRESCIRQAPAGQPYHKYVLKGYAKNMIPITPCRNHRLKTLKTVLKKFETGGTAAALEYHFDSQSPPVDVNNLRPIPKFSDSFKQWKHNDELDSSPWTKALNDSRTKRMAAYRKMFGEDPVYGFTSNWDRPNRKKCQE